jgi:hypothetical protein
MKAYIKKNEDRFLKELFDVLSIPSVSSQKEHKGDMVKCANKLTEMLLASGADKAQVYETDGHPVVYAEK